MGTRKPTPAMQEMYAKKKADTLSRIRFVIREMKDTGELVTKKSLMERAEVSSGTLSKPYVIDLLKKEQVCQFAAIPASSKGLSTEKTLSALAKENQQLRKKVEGLEERIVVLQKQKAKALKECQQEKESNEFLRGQRQLLLERLASTGVSLGEIKLVK